MSKEEVAQVDEMQPNQIELIRQKNREVFENLVQSYPELVKWLDQLGRFGANLVDGAVLGERKDGEFRVLLFTERRSYFIRITSSYLGCQVSARTPRAGEDWTRGRDLTDGPPTKETWDAIVRDMLAFELVRLGT